MAKFETVDRRAQAPAPGQAPTPRGEVPGEAREAHGGPGRPAHPEKGDDPKELRRALKAAAGNLNRRIRFPFLGRMGHLASISKRRGGGGRGRSL